MTAPLLCIITVVCRNRAGLAATRASLGSNLPKGVEWLVADGGSEDDTLAALNGPGPQPHWLDSRPDGGPFGGMDRALVHATGTHVLFLNAGDQLAGADILGELLALLAEPQPPDLIYGDTAEDPGDGHFRRKPARHWRWAFYGMPAHHCAILYRRTLLEGLKFDCGYRLAGDYAVTLESLQRAREIRRIPLLLATFASGGLSRQHAALGRNEQHLVRLYQLKMPAFVSQTIKLLQIVAGSFRKHIPKWYAIVRFNGH